ALHAITFADPHLADLAARSRRERRPRQRTCLAEQDVARVQRALARFAHLDVGRSAPARSAAARRFLRLVACDAKGEQEEKKSRRRHPVRLERPRHPSKEPGTSLTFVYTGFSAKIERFGGRVTVCSTNASRMRAADGVLCPMRSAD